MNRTRTLVMRLETDKEDAEFLRTLSDSMQIALNFVSKKVHKKLMIFKTKELSKEKIRAGIDAIKKETFDKVSQMVPSFLVDSVYKRIQTVYSIRFSNRKSKSFWGPIPYQQFAPQLYLMDKSAGVIVYNKLYIGDRVISIYREPSDERIVYPYYNIWHENGKWKVSGIYHKNVPNNSTSINKVIGIDLGENNIATCYDGYQVRYFNQEFIQRKKQLNKLLKSLEAKGTKGAKKKAAIASKKFKIWFTNIAHEVAAHIMKEFNVDSHTALILENLNRKNMKVSEYWSWYEVKQYIIEKAQEVGATVIDVNPMYTSTTCPTCGTVDEKSRNKMIHKFYCTKCKAVYNDDEAAAINIRNKGLKENNINLT